MNKKTSERGFTLIEIILAIALTAMIGLAVAGVIGSVPTFYLRIHNQNVVNQAVESTLEFVGRELRGAVRFDNTYEIINDQIVFTNSKATQIVFVNDSGDTITYNINGSQLRRKVNNGSFELLLENVSAATQYFQYFDYENVGLGTERRFDQITVTINGSNILIRPRCIRGADSTTYAGWVE